MSLSFSENFRVKKVNSIIHATVFNQNLYCIFRHTKNDIWTHIPKDFKKVISKQQVLLHLALTEDTLPERCSATDTPRLAAGHRSEVADR